MRYTTFKILNNVVYHQAFLNLSLKNEQHEQINQITIRCYGVVQNYFYLNYLIDQLSERKKLDNKTTLVLMLAIYEKLYLNSSKDYVIISEYQKLIKQVNSKALPYVSYFLNNYIKDLAFIVPSFKDEIKNISLTYSHPKWFVKKLITQYPNNYEQILKANNEQKQLTARILKNVVNEYEYLYEDFVKIDSNIYNNDDFLNNNIVIQGLGSYLTSKLLGNDKNCDCLDLCAAPGNKTMHLSTLFKTVYANEYNENRFHLLTNSLAKYGIINTCTFNCDAQNFDELNSVLNNKKFKYILTDVPCSGTGTLRSKPELRLTLNNEEINSIKTVQYNIFKTALNFLEADGVIVYATCSIDREENELQIEKFINEFNLVECTDTDFKQYDDANSKYGVTILPYTNNSDGFYMCKLKRK